jgi:hypothetical protein
VAGEEFGTVEESGERYRFAMANVKVFSNQIPVLYFTDEEGKFVNVKVVIIL